MKYKRQIRVMVSRKPHALEIDGSNPSSVIQKMEKNLEYKTEDWTIEQWQNVLKQRGAIDPQTVAYAEAKIKELRERELNNQNSQDYYYL